MLLIKQRKITENTEEIKLHALYAVFISHIQILSKFKSYLKPTCFKY